MVDWFQRLTGFRETSGDAVRATIEIDGPVLRSKVNAWEGRLDTLTPAVFVRAATMIRRLLVVALVGALVTAGCRADPEIADSDPAEVTVGTDNESDSADALDPLYLRSDAPISDRVNDLLGRMTLAEKVGQMTLVQKNSIATVDLAGIGIGGLLSGGGGSPLENTPKAWAEMVDEFQGEALESRLGVPLIYGVDAVHGHSNVKGAVIFPHNIGLGAANDADLMETIGRITAEEMVATGIYWNYAPAVSVPRDIRWGRTYEGFSEDTARVTDLSSAYLRGLQGSDLAAADTVLATPKHFVGDGGTTWGSSTTADYWIDQGVTEIDEAELRALHLPPYEKAIADGALSIMASYSSWGGEKMHAQEYLLTDVLKDELGFEGFVVSDWAGVDQISDDYSEAVIRSINAGVDMNMVPNDYRQFISVLTDAVDNGEVSEDRIDDAVTRILRAKFSLGLFERPFSDPDQLADVGSPEHRAVAREAVAKSLVLLKNDGDILPLDPALATLYVGGAAADDIGRQSGGWTIEWQGGAGPITEGTSILDAITDTVSPETTVVHERTGRFEPLDAEPMSCLAVVGEQPYAEGRGDKGEPALSDSETAMLDTMREQCDRLAVVLLSGRPLLVTDQIDSWDALVAAWLPGTEGRGVADVLFGLEPFTGTLPYTWPRTAEQLPAGAGAGEPLFPFGFALR